MTCSSRPPGRTCRARALAAALLLLPLAACGSTGGPGSGSGGPDEDATLTLLAAASLTEVYADLADRLEAQRPGLEVRVSLGSSTDLAEQAADGAPGDVLSTADETSMGIAEEAGVVDDPVVFARNTLVLAVPAADPAGIDSLADLDGTTWVRCADEVPCGRVALAVLEDNGVTAEPASLEEDVKAALEKVTSGEADAALVYASDAVAAGDAVRTVELSGAEERATSYYAGTLSQATDPALAGAWVELLLSEEGRAALRAAGFDSP